MDSITNPRRLLLVEGLAFLAAALVHSGLWLSGYAHSQASRAETIIGLVLLAGLALTFLQPRATRAIGAVVQAFALLGTLVGTALVAVGVGPRTVPDIVFHVVLLTVLGVGLAAMLRSSPPERSPH